MNTSFFSFLTTLSIFSALSAQAVAGDVSEAFIRKHADLICEDETTLIGVDTKNSRAWQHDADKVSGWEIVVASFETLPVCAGCFKLQGAFALDVSGSPLPLHFQVWIETRATSGTDETSLVLDYRFGIGRPQGERLDIPCRKH